MYAFETLEESIIHVIELKMPTSRRNREAKEIEVVYRMKGGLAMDLAWVCVTNSDARLIRSKLKIESPSALNFLPNFSCWDKSLQLYILIFP